MKTDEGAAHARRYYERYIAMAKRAALGFVLESPTWRANPRLGRRSSAIRATRLPTSTARSIELMAELRDAARDAAHRRS